MKIQQLIQTLKKPDVYTGGTAVMWVDDHISRQLLDIHLSQDSDLASRKAETISTTVRWILGKVPGNRLNILDLGCGPGLYTEELAKNGHEVTGMDFSANSIRYAMETSAKNDLGIAYRHQDYLTLDDENRYDLILMIYTDFGVLLPDQRSRLLTNVYRALKPGGTFVFDVLNTHFQADRSEPNTWDAAMGGFWRSTPYLALSSLFFYEDQGVTLDQHVIIDEDGKTDVYRFWIHTFSHADLSVMTRLHGFKATDCFDHVLMGCNVHRPGDVTFCIAVK